MAPSPAPTNAAPACSKPPPAATVFLDEVAELPLPAQAALLRVLENHTFQRVGSTQELTTDVRVVAATHCDLEAAVAEGTFAATCCIASTRSRSSCRRCASASPSSSR